VEKEREKEFQGSYDYKSLLQHITHNSLPTVLDIGRGYTSEHLFSPNVDSILLLLYDPEDNHGLVRLKFHELASNHRSAAIQEPVRIFSEVNVKKSANLDKFLDSLQLGANELPVLCSIDKASIQCTKKLDAGSLKDYVDSAEKMGHKVELSPKQPNPLAYIQLERVNELFGFQEVELLPEPILASGASMASHNHHNFDEMDASSISGCPMMAHLNNLHNPRDEL